MKKLLFCLMALAVLVLSGCEEGGRLSTDFSGMWAFVADYNSGSGKTTYDKVDEVLSFEGSRIKLYYTKRDEGYNFKNGYMECSKNDLYDPSIYSFELHKDRCFVYYDGDELGYIQIRGNKLYWYYDSDNYDIYERIVGFSER